MIHMSREGRIEEQMRRQELRQLEVRIGHLKFARDIVEERREERHGPDLVDAPKGAIDLAICDLEAKHAQLKGLIEGTHVQVRAALGLAADGAFVAYGTDSASVQNMQDRVRFIGLGEVLWIRTIVRKPSVLTQRTVEGETETEP